MPYEKQTFVDHETKLSAEHLQYIEDGIMEAFNEIQVVRNLAGRGLPIPEAAEVGQFIKVSEVDENGKVVATEVVTIETEVPVFDLVAMGLPTIEVDGLASNVQADLTEIGAALAAGPVKLLVKTSLEGVEETTTCVGTGFYKPADDTWQVVSRTHYNNKMMTGVVNFILSQNWINAFSFTEQVSVTDEYINALIDVKLGVIENGTY